MKAEQGGEEGFGTGVLTLEECDRFSLKLGGVVGERGQTLEESMHLWRRLSKQVQE